MSQINADDYNNRRLSGMPSQAAKDNLFYVQEIGMISCQPNYYHICDIMDSFLFLVVLRGNGILSYDGKSYKLKSGCAVWIDCKTGYSFTSSSDSPPLILWAYCNGLTMNNLFSFFRKKQDSVLIYVKELKVFIDIYSGIEKFLTDRRFDFEYSISLKIHELINIMTAFSQENDGISNIVSSISEKGALIKEYIEQNFDRKITLDDLSREFCVSKYYMLRSFKNQYNMTIIHYLQLCRINNAKKLLRFSDMQIEAVSRKCGIDDVSYFNKIFRSFEGMTAGQFRKKWKK